MLAAVLGEVAVVAVDHGQAGAHVAGKVEGRDAGAERERRKAVPQIVTRLIGSIPSSRWAGFHSRLRKLRRSR
jgi:hypothetical protein